MLKHRRVVVGRSHELECDSPDLVALRRGRQLDAAPRDALGPSWIGCFSVDWLSPDRTGREHRGRSPLALLGRGVGPARGRQPLQPTHQTRRPYQVTLRTSDAQFTVHPVRRRARQRYAPRRWELLVTTSPTTLKWVMFPTA